MQGGATCGRANKWSLTSWGFPPKTRVGTKKKVMIITLINNTIFKTKSKRNWTINKDRYLQYVSRRVQYLADTRRVARSN